MKAGRLRHLVTVQQLTAGSPQQTPEGEPDVSWTAYCTVPASVEPVIGREFFAADQIQSEVDTKIDMRYESGVNDGITTLMRVLHGSTIYNIKAAINVRMLNREWVLYCETGANEG